MRIEKNWECGMRTTCRNNIDNNIVELFIKIRTSVNFCRLKQKLRETCREEIVWMHVNNTTLEHAKVIGGLA